MASPDCSLQVFKQHRIDGRVAKTGKRRKAGGEECRGIQSLQRCSECVTVGDPCDDDILGAHHLGMATDTTGDTTHDVLTAQPTRVE